MATIYRGTRLTPTAEMAAAIAAAGHAQRVEPTAWWIKGSHVDGAGRPDIKVTGWHIVTTGEVETVLASVLADTAHDPKGEARRLKRQALVTKRLSLIPA